MLNHDSSSNAFVRIHATARKSQSDSKLEMTNSSNQIDNFSVISSGMKWNREISFIIIVREEILQEKHETPPKQG